MKPEEYAYLQSNKSMIDNIEKKLSGENRIVRDAISSVYNKIAKLITKALFTLGLDSCAYIIHKFPKNIRESVYELIKKEVQHYEDIQKLVDHSDLEIKGGAEESGKEFDKNAAEESGKEFDKKAAEESGKDFDKKAAEQRDKIISIVKVEFDKINKDQWKEVTTYFGSNNNWDFSVKLIRIGLAILLARFIQTTGIIENKYLAHVGAHGSLDLTLWIGKGLYFWNSNTNPSLPNKSSSPNVNASSQGPLEFLSQGPLNYFSNVMSNKSHVHEETREERKKREKREKAEKKYEEKLKSEKKGGSMTQKRYKTTRMYKNHKTNKNRLHK
jgi:hypothetical protein